MLRAVLDTNVIVSGLLSRDSPPAQTLDAWRGRQFLVLCSPAILSEINRVLRYPRIQQRYSISEQDVLEVTALFEQNALILHGKPALAGNLPADPDNEMFLACALEGDAQAIVSGDHHLLELGSYQGIPIVTARQFLDTLKSGT